VVDADNNRIMSLKRLPLTESSVFNKLARWKSGPKLALAFLNRALDAILMGERWNEEASKSSNLPTISIKYPTCGLTCEELI
jgi:hypothetical protein